MRGFSWSDGNGGWTYTNIIQTPNHDSVFQGGGCRFNCAGCGIDSSFSYAVSSNHPGGANILMADGSVRFVKDAVSRLTWWALGTRNGNEVISSDSIDVQARPGRGRWAVPPSCRRLDEMMRFNVTRMPASTALRLGLLAAFLAVAGCSETATGDKREDAALKSSMEKSLAIYKSKSQVSGGAPDEVAGEPGTVEGISGEVTSGDDKALILGPIVAIRTPWMQTPDFPPASCLMNGLPIIALASLLAVAPPENVPARPRVLAFTRTAGFRHDAIPAGLAAVRELGTEGGFVVDATEDAATFTAENLARYRAVVFLNTSGEVLDERQKAAFQGFIRGGGGLAAVHQGITTLEKWPWYVALVGGVKFAGHPEVQEATCKREVRDHPATRSLPDSWKWADEWYNFDSNPRPRTHVLLTIDESSYHGGTMGKDHPVCWYHESQGGRVWCTALGHTKEGYGRAPLRQHLLGGIRYAAGLASADGKAGEGTGGPGGCIDRLRSRRHSPGTHGNTPATRPTVAPCSSKPRAPACPVPSGRGLGGDIGPDLSEVGGKYERHLLIESVLEPSRHIVKGYRPEILATDGRAGPLRAGPRRVGPYTDPGRRRGPADQPWPRPRSRTAGPARRR